MKKTEEKIINNNKYVVTQFPATKGVKMLHRVGKYIAGPLSQLAGEIRPGQNIMNAEVTNEGIGKAVTAFFEACDENTFENTVKELLTSTTRNNLPINFDLDFSGNIGELLKVLAFVIEVNYKDFFSGFAGFQK